MCACDDLSSTDSRKEAISFTQQVSWAIRRMFRENPGHDVVLSEVVAKILGQNIADGLKRRPVHHMVHGDIPIVLRNRETTHPALKRRLDRCPRWCMALFFLSAVTCMNAETRSPRWKSKRSAQYAECYTVKRVERPRSHPSFLANINIHHPRKHFLHHQVHFGNISTEALNGSPIPTTPPQHRNWRKKINEASSPRFFFHGNQEGCEPP
jgi:hypothetical protein